MNARPDISDALGRSWWRSYGPYVRAASGWAFLIVLTIVCVQFGRGIKDEYARMASALRAAELRAEAAEGQLALMLQTGDKGIHLATLRLDSGPAELRVVPVVRGR